MRKYKKMDDHLLLYTLLHGDRYCVDIETGEVTSVFFNGGKLKTFYSSDKVDPFKKHPCVRIQINGHRRNVSVCRIIWMVSRKRVIPEDFEIHHLDGNSNHNHYENLVALYKEDHLMIHKLSTDLDCFVGSHESSIPF